MSQPPRLCNAFGESYPSYEVGVRRIAVHLARMQPEDPQAMFDYHDYSAFRFLVDREADGFRIHAGYTGKRLNSIDWTPDDAHDLVAAHFGLNEGHDTETVTRLLTDLGAAIQEAQVA